MSKEEGVRLTSAEVDLLALAQRGELDTTWGHPGVEAQERSPEGLTPMEQEANRLAQVLDISPATALRGLQNLISRGLVAALQTQEPRP